VASGGGHWIQMMRLRSAFEGLEQVFVCVDHAYREQVPEARFHRVNDANQDSKLALLVLALRVLWVVLRERPDLVVSTGAAPGYFGLRIGKLLGARTIWVDSIANAEILSLSGRIVKPYADLWLTQWPELAREGGPEYRGQVL
jgi:UDP-N-acetylglucosamine:LPS N-acetylglucosamine transferase